jgi:hypothetical protein
MNFSLVRQAACRNDPARTTGQNAPESLQLITAALKNYRQILLFPEAK